MKLPTETIVNLTEKNMALLELIFNEMNKSTSNEELLDACTDCIIQLLVVSRKSKKFENLSNYLLSKIQILATHVP